MSYAEDVINTVGVEASRRLVLDAYGYNPGPVPLQKLLREGSYPTLRMMADPRGAFYELVRDAITVCDYGPGFRATMARKHGRAGVRLVCGECGARLTFTPPDGKTTDGSVLASSVSFQEIAAAADALIAAAARQIVAKTAQSGK